MYVNNVILYSGLSRTYFDLGGGGGCPLNCPNMLFLQNCPNFIGCADTPPPPVATPLTIFNLHLSKLEYLGIQLGYPETEDA